MTTLGSVERTESCCAEIRHPLHRLLESLNVSASDTFDILLAAGEVVANAVLHGRGPLIQWSATARAQQVVIEITYETDPFDTRPRREEASSEKEGGRGILLMYATMDSVRFRFCRGKVSVTLEKRF
jgi:anti-sigma regulatory factor (Ser/Thr protein kinase)